MQVIRNRRLLAALLRKARVHAETPLTLLGGELDAIVQPTRRHALSWMDWVVYPSGQADRRMPVAPTPAERLERYHDALHFHATADHEKRAFTGEVLQIRMKRSHTLRSPIGNVVLLDSARRAWARTGASR